MSKKLRDYFENISAEAKRVDKEISDRTLAFQKGIAKISKFYLISGLVVAIFSFGYFASTFSDFILVDSQLIALVFAGSSCIISLLSFIVMTKKKKVKLAINKKEMNLHENVAVVYEWAKFEAVAYEFLRRKKKIVRPIPLRKLIEELENEDLLDREEIEFLFDFLSIRNAVVHTGAVYSSKNLTEKIAHIAKIIERIRSNV